MDNRVYVKRNPLAYYRYNTPEHLPYIQWRLVSKGVAYNMVHSKQIGWERAKKGEYEDWCVRMEKLRKENL